MVVKKPNILFFFTDDQRFDTIRALGNKQIYTPNIDCLTKEGTVFTHAHIPGGTCGAVCMPSRAMLHTGRTLFHIEGEGQNIPVTHITIGEWFRKNGYETIGIGKWHNGRESYARSFSAGDEIFFGGMADHWNVPAYHYDPAGHYEKKSPYIKDPFYSNSLEFHECDHIEVGKHSTDLFTEAAIRLLEEQKGQKPFFMYIAMMAPHDPRTMPEKFRRMYKPESIKLPSNFMMEHPIDTGALKIRDELLAAFPRKPAEIKRHIAEYYAMISHLDDAFGRLRQILVKRGLWENTIIVFSGDNGLAVGQHGLMGKQNLYEHSVRVPLIFAGPNIPRGKKCDGLVYLLDVFPTLCELAGISVPASVEGKSLLNCFTNDEKTRDYLYLAYASSIRGVTDGDYKLIEYACGKTQLFDLKNDPAEITNLVGNKKYKDCLAEMRVKLCMLAEEWDDKKHPCGKEFWHRRKDIKV